MTLPPELVRLVESIEPAPADILATFRNNLHDVAHALIDIADLDESCDEVEERIATWDDRALTLLLFHLGIIQPVIVPPGAWVQLDDEEEGDEQPKLLN